MYSLTSTLSLAATSLLAVGAIFGQAKLLTSVKDSDSDYHFVIVGGGWFFIRIKFAAAHYSLQAAQLEVS